MTTSSGEFLTTPTLGRMGAGRIGVMSDVPSSATAVAVPIGVGGAVPDLFGLTRPQLVAAGFDGSVGSTLLVPAASGPVLVAVGVGDETLDASGLRDAAAAFARAAADHTDLAIVLAGTDPLPASAAAQAAVEGALLARYRYDPLRRAPQGTGIEHLTIVSGDSDEATEGARRGEVFASTTELARDFANTPHSHLNASGLADVAVELAARHDLAVEVFDKEQLVEMGCGGLLGVNQGSVEPPRMIKLTYAPSNPTARLALVGKGIMYDSGGLSIKPGDEVHAQMKNDMSGAAAVLAAMSGLSASACPVAVTAFLMCTDNMPSGTAMALGDVLTIRGGTTVEVINTDAEGRLVMADALVLAVEEGFDAIIDVATLTGACMRALGTEVAGVMGNEQGLIDQIRAAAEATDEPVWQLPLERRYRKQLDSTVADLRNLGGANAGAITAALFLAEFVGDVPWAHIDIAGTAQSEGESGWRTAGCTGFGARLVLQTALGFEAPA